MAGRNKRTPSAKKILAVKKAQRAAAAKKQAAARSEGLFGTKKKEAALLNQARQIRKGMKGPRKLKKK